MLKDDLGLPLEGMAMFFAVAGLAWYLKPFAGLRSDQVPLRGTRRRHYLLLSGPGGARTWAAASLAPADGAALVVCLVIAGGCVVLGNSSAGGLLVDVERTRGISGCGLTSPSSRKGSCSASNAEAGGDDLGAAVHVAPAPTPDPVAPQARPLAAAGRTPAGEEVFREVGLTSLESCGSRWAW